MPTFYSSHSTLAFHRQKHSFHVPLITALIKKHYYCMPNTKPPCQRTTIKKKWIIEDKITIVVLCHSHQLHPSSFTHLCILKTTLFSVDTFCQLISTVFSPCIFVYQSLNISILFQSKNSSTHPVCNFCHDCRHSDESQRLFALEFSSFLRH